KAHRGARHKALRVGDELVEVVERPVAALGLHRGRKVETAFALALLLADDAIEVRADAVRAALLKSVAGRALLGGGCALLDGGGLQQFLDRLRRRGGGSTAAMGLFLHG